MIWVQGGVCFLLWVGYGVYQTRRSDAVRRWAIGVPKTRRALLSAALMLSSTGIVFACLIAALKNGGFGNNGMTLVVWLGVALLGLLFVHAQTLATALLVLAAHQAVTDSRSGSSTNQTHQETDLP